MDRFARIVLGYHGCAPDFSESLIRGETPISEWRASRNPYDWLGEGICFWEHAPERARGWGGKGGVVGAVIQLTDCLDFADVKYTNLLATHFRVVRTMYEAEGKPLPSNKGKAHRLDCLVINDLVKMAETLQVPFRTVRCPFMEGRPAFPDSRIHKESHIQIAVLDLQCILGVFRPNLRRRK